MDDQQLEKEIMDMIEDARLFRESVRAVKSGGKSYNDTWAMVPFADAKRAGLI